jgi:ComF family protein
MADRLAIMEAWAQGLGRRAWRGLVDFLTPPRCLACHQALTEASCLCAICWARLQQIDEPVCEVMGTPFAYDQGEGAVSAAGLANPPPWNRARAAVAYDDASRGIVHALKFHDTQEAGLLMARMMARAGRKLLAEADVIVPVPLHRIRLWRRRFNQAGYLALRLSEQSGKPCRTDVLGRRKASRPQVGLDHQARRKNVRGVFAVDATKGLDVSGRNMLLVDDVMTTGATAGACVTALLQAGAARVDVLTFALVLSPARLHS